MVPTPFSSLKGGVDVLTTCVGVTSTLTAAEVAMLTNAWAELLTTSSVNDDIVSCSCVRMSFALTNVAVSN